MNSRLAVRNVLLGGTGIRPTLPRAPFCSPNHRRNSVVRLALQPTQTAAPLPVLQQETATSKALAAVQFLGTPALCSTAAWFAQPLLVRFFNEALVVGESVDGPFETSFFGLIGIIYGLMGGNTFLFLYERQVNTAQELYGECFALELLVQQVLMAVPDQGSRREMAQSIRRYLAEEVYSPVDMVSPFAPDSSYSDVVNMVCQEKARGVDVSGMVAAVQKLADAQSRRSAVAAQVLPSIHWVFLNSLLAIFLICFLVFDAGSEMAEAAGAVGGVERRLGFSSLVGVLVLTQQVLYDLSEPINGLYTFRASLEGRLSYLLSLVDVMETAPSGYIPPELARLGELGLVSKLTESEESPSTASPLTHGRKKKVDGSHSYTGGALHTWAQQPGATVHANKNGAHPRSSGV